jgi:hypothetical protein
MARAFKTAKDDFVGSRRTYGNEPDVEPFKSLRELRQSIAEQRETTNNKLWEAERDLGARASTLEGDVHLLRA